MFTICPFQVIQTGFCQESQSENLIRMPPNWQPTVRLVGVKVDRKAH